MNRYATLFSPFTLGGVPLRNRIVMLPMTTGFCERDGTVGPRLVDFFAARAQGGAGLIIAPFTPVHTGSAVDAGLFDDRFTQPATRLTTAVHEAGAKISAQLIVTYKAAFPDGGEHGAAEVVGPSPVPNALLRVVPRELTVEEIHYLAAAYGRAAARAKAAGFDMVEVMAGGGYLVNRFLSPLTNRREDEYGGSLEKRLRFLLDIVWSIRREAGDGFPVMVRLNLDEQMAGGYSPADALEMARLLERRGAAGFTSYTGWHESPVPTVQASVEKAGFAHLAARLREAVRVPVIAANRINDPVTAERVLAEGNADLAGAGRAFLADAAWPLKAYEDRADEIVPCIACSSCLTAMLTTYKRWDEPVTTLCAVNPSLAVEAVKPRPRKVLIIGGGPAGLEAAYTCATLGHHVTLYEKADRLGGRLLVAALPPYKQELEDLVRALATRAERAGVSIRLGETVDRRLLEQEAPEALVVAVGAAPWKPDAPGIDGDNVVLAEQVLTGEAVPSGPVVIVGGGLVGCETAEHVTRLAPSVRVTVVEMLDKMAANVPATSRPFLLARLRAERVVLLPGRKVVEVGSGYVTLEGAEETIRVEAGMVVLATGYKPDQGMITEFLGTVPRTCLIGDCAGGRTIKEAMEAGFAAGRSI